ncbi:MAG: endo-1,4-beta-xylanase [Parvularculaceae bacterium]|nr:endo-1,4-beta-xylanase [Parvularculaceae bacterium]
MVCDPAGRGPRPCGRTKSGTQFTARDADLYRRAIRSRMNSVGFENTLKWPAYEEDRSLPIEALRWLDANNVPFVRGHNLIWPGGFGPQSNLPADIRANSSPTYVARRVDDHFDEILGALKGRVPEWDVVNEPFDNYDIQGRIAAPGVDRRQGILPTASIADWFKNARRADPDAALFLNDFDVLENALPQKSAFNLALIDFIRRNGGEVDGMGFQGHFGQSGPDFLRMQTVVNQFSPVVQSLAITEFDVDTLDETLQADITDDMMVFAFSQPKFTGFEIWGFWDGDHWLGNSPVYRADWSLKPSGRRWLDRINNKWKTPPALRTTSIDGTASLDGFRGDYGLTATINGRRCRYDAVLNARRTTLTLTAC